MSFFGREKELEVLEKAFASSQTEFIPIYGRRRVGKSELIHHFIQKKTALYFLGKKSTPTLLMREFLREAARVFKKPLLATAQASDWSEVIKLVLAEKKTSRKFILVFDEFQWIAEASPELPSLFQGFLDQDWKKSKNILLILCGSYMGFMEKEILGEKSPLFGRRTAQIFLQPFSFREATQFHHSWPLREQAKVYFLCGGIPLYLKFFLEKNSLEKNLENNFFNEYAPLFREPDFLLREELRELQRYYAVLMCLAQQAGTMKEMAEKTGIDEKKIYYYLQHLIELRYIRRHFPLLTKNTPSKNVRFVLEDPLLAFWFRFIYPNMAYISQMGPKNSFQNLVKPHLDAYFGLRFERLCREALAFLYQKEGVSTSFEIGTYWDKTTQIDVVGYRQKEALDLGECKWGRISSIKKLIENLQKKMERYPNPKGLRKIGRIFSQNKIKKADSLPHNIIFHSLEDLYIV